jgi:hypothetical protein
MANGNDIDESVSVRDALNDAPLADTDAPKVASTFKLRDSYGAGIYHERFNLFEYPPADLPIQILELLARRSCKDDRVISHAAYVWRGSTRRFTVASDSRRSPRRL